MNLPSPESNHDNLARLSDTLQYVTSNLLEAASEPKKPPYDAATLEMQQIGQAAVASLQGYEKLKYDIQQSEFGEGPTPEPGLSPEEIVQSKIIELFGTIFDPNDTEDQHGWRCEHVANGSFVLSKAAWDRDTLIVDSVSFTGSGPNFLVKEHIELDHTLEIDDEESDDGKSTDTALTMHDIDMPAVSMPWAICLFETAIDRFQAITAVMQYDSDEPLS